MDPSASERFVAVRGEVHVEHLGTEVLVYDMATDQVHHLAPAAAAVWEACHAPVGIEELASSTGRAAAEVERALAELGAAGLVRSEGSTAGLSRRRFARLAAAGATAAAGAALVSSFAAPTPAAADSWVPPTDSTIDPPTCGPNEEYVEGQCECLPGYVRNEDGICVVDESTLCGPNEEYVDGACECMAGYVRNEFGDCVRDFGG